MKVNAMSYAHLVKMLMEGTRTADELSEETGLHKNTIYQYTRELHKVNAVHIACWEQDALGRDCKPVFMIGAKPDAKRHKLTALQRSTNYRARKKIGARASLNGWLQGATV